MMRRSVLILGVAASSLVGVRAMADAANETSAAGTTQYVAAAKMPPVEMKRYRNDAWKFELDIPKRWQVTPPGSDNSVLARFISVENGHHLVMISRHLVRPPQTAKDVADQNQKAFTEKGYSNFARSETLIGTIKATTLDYEITASNGSVTYWRQYYVIKGPVGYQLAFGTTNREVMLTLYKRMAKTFVFEDL